MNKTIKENAEAVAADKKEALKAVDDDVVTQEETDKLNEKGAAVKACDDELKAAKDAAAKENAEAKEENMKISSKIGLFFKNLATKIAQFFKKLFKKA